MKKYLLLLCAAAALFAACDLGSSPEKGRGGDLLDIQDSGSGNSGGDEGGDGGSGGDNPRAQYESALQDFANIVAATKISNDSGQTVAGEATPVYIGWYWASPADLATLNNAIAEIEEEARWLISAGISTQLDSFVERIQAAIAAFEGQRTMGTRSFDWNTLQTAYDSAAALYTGLDFSSTPAVESLLDYLDTEAGIMYVKWEIAEAGRTINEVGEWLTENKNDTTGTVTYDDMMERVNALTGLPNPSEPYVKGYWATIPAGQFQRDNTATNISIITKPYKVAIYEVTQDLWTEVMGVNYSSNMRTPTGHSQYTGYQAKLPVDGGQSAGVSTTNMGLPHIYAFCNRLSTMKGKTPVYSRSGGTAIDSGSYPGGALITDLVVNPNANGYRLPTEMEWMWAAMGANLNSADMSGGINIRGYSKAFAGDDLDNPGDAATDYAWIAANNGNPTKGDNQPSFSHLVGTKLPNELGIYDMSGNVGELCVDFTPDGKSWPTGTLTDWWDNRSNSGRRAYIGGDYADQHPYSVSRGTGNGLGGSANYTHRYVGFRIVCNAEQP